jgi:hypothetical protein
MRNHNPIPRRSFAAVVLFLPHLPKEPEQTAPKCAPSEPPKIWVGVARPQ